MYSNESREVTEERNVARSVLLWTMVVFGLWAVFAIALPAVAHAQQAQSTERPHLRTVQTTAHGVVLYSTLPHCVNEDGPGLRQHVHRCTWNIGSPQDGNGRGLAYVVSRINGEPYFRYVWNHNPNRGGWHWVGGPHSDSVCVVKRFGDRLVNRCPNGQSQSTEPRS